MAVFIYSRPMLKFSVDTGDAGAALPAMLLPCSNALLAQVTRKNL